ncbi:hypothetical protein [Streptomyces scabiei]|uniref:hypothetical protein n=1 Tax=Streptomyces scabiei TaxID=1930 RepID=UPI000A5BCEF7|nr:hypothetical protein [Streptomyces scabiei]
MGLTKDLKTETGSGTIWTQTGSKVNHYGDDSDNPRRLVEDTDIPSWARGKGKRAGESIDEAVDRMFREHYGRNSTPKER